MIVPLLKELSSTDLARGRLPPDPTDCSILFYAVVGEAGGAGAEGFYFAAVTPIALLQAGAAEWGRGLLILPRFSWPAVEAKLRNLLAGAHRETWVEVVDELSKSLKRERPSATG